MSVSKKILNLYAGIGGNRKLWDEVMDVDVTAVEWNEDIADIYQDFFPDDEVIVKDAHKYLKEHYEDGWDFIWASPPCPTHSRMNFLSHVQEGKEIKYPDMKLWQEIIFLDNWFDGKYCVENVKTYYQPLIDCYESGNHYLWSNFNITNIETGKNKIDIRNNYEGFLEEKTGFDLNDYDMTKKEKEKVLNNCVHPKLGKHILECAFKKKQLSLEDIND